MAFRALLFSKSPETNAALATACKSAGIRVEVCSDIFAAIEKGTKQPFSCVLADWSDQPETGFLFKRTRESSSSANLVAIAIVDRDPTAAEMRDNHLDFLIYRPIFAGEAQDVLTKAAEKMQPVAVKEIPDTPAADEQPSDTTASVLTQSPDEGQYQYNETAGAIEEAPPENAEDLEPADEEPFVPRHPFPIRQACAAVLVLAAAFCLWNARDTILYLARTREGRIKILRESVAALFYLNPSGATPVGAVSSEAQQDAYFSRSPNSAPAQTSTIAVVPTQVEVSESHVPAPKAADFPLPAPVYQPAPTPVHVERAAIPDSLRGSAPITPPVVVTVTPAQMMPVSTPATPPIPQQFSEPVNVSEETARALLVRTVDPTYPPEAIAQNLHGPVVLQATIGRDGSVEDLKIVRGSFILCKAAIAAVKQWRFQPYTLNGRPAQTQTVITINFSAPPS